MKKIILILCISLLTNLNAIEPGKRVWNIAADTEEKVCTIDSKVDIINQTTQQIELQLNNISGSALDDLVATLTYLIDLTEVVSSDFEVISSIADSISGNIGDFESVLDAIGNSVGPINSKLMIIDSKVCIIDSETDVLIETTDTIESKVCIIDSKIDVNKNLIISTSDEILSQIDSAEGIIIRKIEDNSLTSTLISPDGFVSEFGDKVAEGREDYVSIQFQYGISDIDLETITSNMGAVTTNQSTAIIQTDGTMNSSARLQSKRNLRYRPGHEGYCFFSAAFTGDIASGTNQWIGLLDDENGYAVGYDGLDFSILYRNDSMDTVVNQSNFNIDPLDGNGPSGINLSADKLNIYRISYGALVDYRILGTDGQWHLFHVVQRAGTAITPLIQNPILPVSAEVSDPVGGNMLELRTTSWNAGIIGGPSLAGSRFFSQSNTKTLGNTGNEIHMLTIKNKDIYASKTNRIEVRIAAFGGGPLTSSGHVMILRIRKNATITGATYSDISPDSVIEYDTAGTYSLGTGSEILVSPINSIGNGPGIQFIPPDGFEIILLPGETATLTAQSLSGGNINSIAQFAWEERFS